MLKVGITGGIGSGKSFICDIFERLGIPIFHADIVSQQIVAKNPEVKTKIIELLGFEVYSDGHLNRNAVSEIVFGNKDLLQKLNDIVHPAVFESFNSWAESQIKYPYILKEAAIIFESGAEKYLDFFITISAPEELRINRVTKRDQVDRRKVLDRVNNQWNDEQRMRKSDFVIANDEKTLLLPQIIETHNTLIEKSKKRIK